MAIICVWRDMGGVVVLSFNYWQPISTTENRFVREEMLNVTFFCMMEAKQEDLQSPATRNLSRGRERERERLSADGHTMEEHEQNDESIFHDRTEPAKRRLRRWWFFSLFSGGSVFRGTSETGRGTAHTFPREISLVCPCFIVVECVRRRRPVTIYYYAA